MNYNKAHRLAGIIVRVKLGTATEIEREELGGWLDESEENRQLYKNIIRGKSIEHRLKTEAEINQRVDLVKVEGILIHKLSKKRKEKNLRIFTRIAVAACLIGIVVASGFFMTGKSDRLPSHEVVAGNIDTKIKLILSSGEEVNLEKEITEQLDVKQAIIKNESGLLSYKSKGNSAQQQIYNKLITSVGGEYAVILCDGTKVWLNAVSELEFPVEFIGKERVVRLSGEAYFEVSHCPERPFIVEVAGMKTRVLGTSFNIKAYQNEKNICTTLLTGSIEVSAPGVQHQLILKPGMESIWEKGTDILDSRNVVAENAIAWKSGVFMFDEENIQVVTRMLSRWYEADFIFDTNMVGQHTFSGRISKDQSLSAILEILSMTGGPKFRQEGNKIYVSEK